MYLSLFVGIGMLINLLGESRNTIGACAPFVRDSKRGVMCGEAERMSAVPWHLVSLRA
jgi:hypothetical protein